MAMSFEPGEGRFWDYEQGVMVEGGTCRHRTRTRDLAGAGAGGPRAAQRAVTTERLTSSTTYPSVFPPLYLYPPVTGVRH